MTELPVRKWAYKADGSACVFTLYPGDELPPGWSHDISIIEEETLRNPDRLSKAAGRSLVEPVCVGDRTPQFQEEEPENYEPPLQYDADLRQIIPIKRGPGRPRKVQDG